MALISTTIRSLHVADALQLYQAALLNGLSLLIQVHCDGAIEGFRYG